MYFSGREKVAMVRLRDPREEDVKPGSPDSVLSSEGNPFVYSTDALSRLRSQNTDWQQIPTYRMPMEDLVNEFGEITICRLVAENLFVVPSNKWRGSSVQGRWQTGPTNSPLDRSGGGDIHSETFLKNPQYLIDISGNVEVMIQLLQYLDLDGLDTPSSNNINLLIGFHVIKVENNRATRLHKLWPHCTVIVVEGHKRKREIVYRGTLSEGRYVLVPSSYRQGEHSSFFLRIFSKAVLLNIKELKEDVPKSRIPCSCIIPEVELVTVVVVDCAIIEHKSQTWSSSKLNVYCALTCEGTTVKTDVSKEESNPVWNSSFIFYRKKPNKPIIVKVFNKNILFPDELIGECELPAAVTHGPTPLDACLFPRTKTSEDSDNPSIGTIHLCVLTEDNLMAV
uniref:C2 domain-containing protein n=1 Tax=Rhodnius prolixus TaxID=13249 RepID=T1HPT9_RHOPR